MLLPENRIEPTPVVERLSSTSGYVIDKGSLKIKMLEHVPTRKSVNFFGTCSMRRG